MSAETASPLTTPEVTALLESLRGGNAEAGERLLPLLYGVLHDIAARLMQGERPDHTLQPTILLHDAWLKLTAERDSPWTDRKHFLALAARAMRRLLVDHARARSAGKRRGDLALPLDDALVADTAPDVVDLIALDDALNGLAKVDDRARQVVELRFFAGLEWEEIGSQLEISDRTAKRDWRFARAWLQQQMEGGQSQAVPSVNDLPPSEV